MPRGGLVPRLQDAVVVLVLLMTGFAAGTLADGGFDASEPSNSSYVAATGYPEGELRQASGESTSFIQAPYTEVNFSISDDSVDVEVDSVSFPEGKSMRPTIFSENTVLLEKYRGGPIREGQIIRYRSGDSYVIHRVEANYVDSAGYLLVKGDNNEYSKRVRPEQVTHRALGVIFTSESSTPA